MKKYLPHIFIVALILGWTGVFGVHEAHAQALAILKFADSPIESIAQFMGNMVLQAMSFFIYISGLLLDYSLNWTLNIASLVEKIPAIETGWKVFRDLCTMFFIFILLYTAITTILGVGGGKENAKKVLMTVVIAGLLINFSLFFTKLVIDASNVVSLGFYKALVPNPDGDLSTSKVFGLKRTGLSAIFMDSLYIQTTYDPSGLKPGLKNDKLAGSASSAEAPPFVRLLINTIMGSIVMLIASIVFLAAAFFFMVRIVMLLLLMVTSPIAFAGEALGGKAASQAKKWWETLINQCLFMPVYLAVTYVGIKIVASPGFQAAVNPGNGSISALTGGGSIAVIFNYCVIIIFLMASLIIAKEFGVMGADTFKGWADTVLKAVPSWTGRKTLGYAGNKAEKYLENTTAGNSRIGRSLREISTGALAGSKFGGSISYKDQAKEDKEIDAKRRQIGDVETIRRGSGAVADRAQVARDKKKTNPAYVYTAAEKADVDAANTAETTLNKMSGSEIAEQTPAMLTQNAAKLNDTHMKAIIKSDKITDADKEKILAARFKELDDARRADPPDPAKIKEAVKKLSKTDIENLGYDRLRDPSVIAALSSSQMKSASESENYSKTQQNEFKALKIKPLLDELTAQEASGVPFGPNPSVKNILTRIGLGSEEIANIGTDNLVRLAKFGSLPTSALPKISESVSTTTDRRRIKEGIAEGCNDILLHDYLINDTPLTTTRVSGLSSEERSIYKFFSENPIGLIFDK